VAEYQQYQDATVEEDGEYEEEGEENYDDWEAYELWLFPWRCWLSLYSLLFSTSQFRKVISIVFSIGH
jgi:hypothetical protein